MIPLRNKQTNTAINALARQLLPFLPAVPKSVLSDNGPEFSSDDMAVFLSKVGIEHWFTTPYCPTSNGAVERVNRTIQNLLKTIVDKGEHWDQHLSRAVIAYNHSVHSETGLSPSQCLLEKSHPRGNIPLQSELQSHWRLGNPKFMPFKKGDLVLKKVEHKGHANVNKLMPKFHGPYKITRVNSKGVTYELEKPTGGVFKGHHSKLKLFKETPNYLSRNEMYKKVALGPGEAVDGNMLPVDISSPESNLFKSQQSAVVNPGAGAVGLVDSESSDSSVVSDMSSTVPSGAGQLSESGESGQSDPCRLCEFERMLEASLNMHNLYLDFVSHTGNYVEEVDRLSNTTVSDVVLPSGREEINLWDPAVGSDMSESARY